MVLPDNKKGIHYEYENTIHYKCLQRIQITQIASFWQLSFETYFVASMELRGGSQSQSGGCVGEDGIVNIMRVFVRRHHTPNHEAIFLREIFNARCPEFGTTPQYLPSVCVVPLSKMASWRIQDCNKEVKVLKASGQDKERRARGQWLTKQT